MNRPIRAMAALLLASALVLPVISHANVVIGGTRVIFPAKDGEVTVRLTNQSPAPALIETWIDSGDQHSTPDKVNTPFLITPPLFRMEPNHDQSLRILFTHSEQPMPTDRESVFYLNVLEIPPKPSGQEFQGKNYVQMAIRSRLKLFYRPAGLSSDPTKAPGELTFQTASGAGPAALVVHNPSPYYVTIGQITVNVGGTAHKVDAGMVPPLSDLHLNVAGLTQSPGAGAAVHYVCINDFGADVTYNGKVSP
jgi:P pilus assembly chaperone PapD